MCHLRRSMHSGWGSAENVCECLLTGLTCMFSAWCSPYDQLHSLCLMHDRQRQSLVLIIAVIVHLTNSTLRIIIIYTHKCAGCIQPLFLHVKRTCQHKAGRPVPECFRLVLIDWKHLDVTGYTFETGALKLWRKASVCSVPSTVRWKTGAWKTLKGNASFLMLKFGRNRDLWMWNQKIKLPVFLASQACICLDLQLQWPLDTNQTRQHLRCMFLRCDKFTGVVVVQSDKL